MFQNPAARIVEARSPIGFAIADTPERSGADRRTDRRIYVRALPTGRHAILPLRESPPAARRPGACGAAARRGRGSALPVEDGKSVRCAWTGEGRAAVAVDVEAGTGPLASRLQAGQGGVAAG